MNSFFKKLSLSNYSLTSQILIINFLTAIIGLFFFIIINFFLISTDTEKRFKIKLKQNNKIINQIANYLEESAILRVRLFNETCEENISKDSDYEIKNNIQECEDIILSEPQLEPTITQKYVIQNYLDENFIVKIYDESWIVYVDTEEMYLSSDVMELDIENFPENRNFFNVYKNLYLNLFQNIHDFFIKIKLQSFFIDFRGDIFVVQETIKKQLSSSNIYLDSENNITQIISKPIVKNSSVYGVVLIKSILNQDENHISIISFNLINLYFIIILIMFLSSLFFSRSLISPIKLLSRITRSEREKSNKKNNLEYPRRKDEIGILGKDISSMSDDLKKRINEIESFASDVSHELKNPLSSLKSSSELLIQNKITEDSKNLLIKNMTKDIERMNILISDISNYTLTQVEIDEEIFEKFDVIVIVEDFIKSLPHNNIKIDFKSNNAPAYIVANKNKLAQVFYNIIHNSFSYSPSKSKILINTIIQDENIIFHIVDQGIGVPLDFKEKIFDRFYTDRLKDKDKHTGLGLSISRKIIESFKGSINLIENHYEIYQGACFEIKLPLKG
ncbi:MAG: HAMP domain-containing histidine kinase [Alphaproteobacteria bacterium]|nr:HAMP domain-containing histidine kinase [Alphaproteobacteria bacterium]